MNPTIIIEGFGVGAGLIIAIGSQNAFVLKKGIMKQHVFITALTCSIIDMLLIILGSMGLGTIISKTPILMISATLFGIVFLSMYGIKSFMAVFQSKSLNSEEDKEDSTSLKVTLITLLAFTLLNPHVYLDTVILLGSIGARYPIVDRTNFVIGACMASFVWFFGLAYGARFFSPLFKKDITWKILDFVIGCVMLTIVYKLFEFGISNYI
ncbi:LysE/ArgO family amino acid transporter [Psychrilyobacter atlanticus]|uniref:LysE/ArgO family amino acid transporter n=1 Tax=Psychrilyobacter atlanticus TaxID=271091 RepID=UPI0003FF9E15|nr:LysE/ArgO family amino acid transporter [Psychrilyobacter atlanticus]